MCGEHFAHDVSTENFSGSGEFEPVWAPLFFAALFWLCFERWWSERSSRFGGPKKWTRGTLPSRFHEMIHGNRSLKIWGIHVASFVCRTLHSVGRGQHCRLSILQWVDKIYSVGHACFSFRCERQKLNTHLSNESFGRFILETFQICRLRSAALGDLLLRGPMRPSLCKHLNCSSACAMALP